MDCYLKLHAFCVKFWLLTRKFVIPVLTRRPHIPAEAAVGPRRASLPPPRPCGVTAPYAKAE